MTPVIVPPATRGIELPETYGLDPERNPILIQKLRNLPAQLRDQILTSKGTTK